MRVLEMSAIGPVPFCAMLLADMGADVLRIARPGQTDPDELRFDVTARSRDSMVIDLKQPDGIRRVHHLAGRAEILLEGSRPGVMERLGLGPDVLHRINPRLVYGRMTGWGQSGPLSRTAGHDINYIALTGALHAIGSAGGAPVPPLNLAGDYGGGALYLALGVVCALLEARGSGEGQVVDAAMTDGSASLMSLFTGLLAQGKWSLNRGSNLLDGGAPWYGTYETSDGGYMAVGALEEPFWEALLAGLELDAASLPPRSDRDGWPAIRRHLADAFRRRDRATWTMLFEASDACVTPVLDLAEAVGHPHNIERGTFCVVDGITQPSPAPRFSRTNLQTPSMPKNLLDEVPKSWA